MTSLSRKLFRDVIHLRGQVIAVAMVVACGIAAFVAMRSTYHSLLNSQAEYYQQYRFADVFAQMKRAPETLSHRIAESRSHHRSDSCGSQCDAGYAGRKRTGARPHRFNPRKQMPMLKDLHIVIGRYIFGVMWMSRDALGLVFDMEGAFNDVSLSLAS